jgi:hypothetical protein
VNAKPTEGPSSDDWWERLRAHELQIGDDERLPSAEDLDAVAEEERIREATK